MKRFLMGFLVAFIVAGVGFVISLMISQSSAPTANFSHQSNFSIPRTSAVLEVVRPAGADDALWQRQIATYAAQVGLDDVVSAVELSRDFHNDAPKMYPSVSTGEGLRAAIHVRQIPGTALIEIRVNCSDDPAVVAAVTQSLADSFFRRMQSQQNHRRALALEDERSFLNSVLDSSKNMESNTEDFIRAYGLDTPPTSTAPARLQRDYAMLRRQLERRQADAAVYQAIVDEHRRIVLQLAMPSTVTDQALCFVQKPQP